MKCGGNAHELQKLWRSVVGCNHLEARCGSVTRRAHFAVLVEQDLEAVEDGQSPHVAATTLQSDLQKECPLL